jgi:hypothetical protein
MPVPLSRSITWLGRVVREVSAHAVSVYRLLALNILSTGPRRYALIAAHPPPATRRRLPPTIVALDLLTCENHFTRHRIPLSES